MSHLPCVLGFLPTKDSRAEMMEMRIDAACKPQIMPIVFVLVFTEWGLTGELYNEKMCFLYRLAFMVARNGALMK